jgi:spore coat polysaccharide biosynthesis protein SpsF
MTALILQARLDSSRLPDKSLLPLGGEQGLPLIYRVMEALNHLPCDVRVLACPEDCVVPFSPWAEKAGFELVPGPREDVLARYCGALRRFPADRLIRATGDNPFVFIDAAIALNRETVELDADYGGYSGLPHGAGVESVNAAALFRAEKEARPGPEREHVCPYIYGHSEFFLLHRPLAPRVWHYPAMRLTIDTQADYDRAQVLYRALDEAPEAGGENRFRGETIIAVYQKTFGPQEGPVPPNGRIAGDRFL